MGWTLEQLAAGMTAKEFGMHMALEAEEPLPSAHAAAVGAVLAGIANGELKPPAGESFWRPSHFTPAAWAVEPEQAAEAPPAADTVQSIMAAASRAGMT